MNNIMHGDLQFGANDFITFTFTARFAMWCTMRVCSVHTQRPTTR